MAVLAEVKIVMHDTGQVEVFAPLENKVLVLGMMEFAKGIIMTAKKPEIIVPTLVAVK